MQQNGNRPDDAVSEAIGFTLIFSLVIIGISLVTLYGYPVLLKQQANADQRIMEKNIIVLQNDVKSLCYKSVPFKETSLKIAGGTLNLYNQSNTVQNFEIKKNGATVADLNNPFKPGELRYVTNDQGLVTTIENGAVIFRQYGSGGSTMLAEPRWYIDIDPINDKTTAVIHLVRMDSTETLGASSGASIVRLALNQTTYTEEPLANGDIITVIYTKDPDNDYSTAWQNYLTNTLNFEDLGGGTYRYQVGTNQGGTLVLKYYDILAKSL